jgi:hypothetical protein
MSETVERGPSSNALQNAFIESVGIAMLAAPWKPPLRLIRRAITKTCSPLKRSFN